MDKKKKSLFMCLLFGVSVFGIIGLAKITGVAAQPNTTLIYGTMSGPVDWDPVFAWDDASFDVLAQITEGLFMCNYSNANAPVIPMLATGYTWSANAKVLTVNLHSGITFQDGTPFNASAVVWNFDRDMWNWGQYMNQSSMVAPFNTGSTTVLAQTYPLVTEANGTQMIETVTAINNTAVRFTLNEPYAAFINLLAFQGNFILSPASTPAKNEINVTASNYRPVGTGPFEFSNFAPNDYVLLKANPNYWRGEAKLGGVYFDIVNDAQTRNNDMLSQTIHILPDPLPTMVSAGSFNITGEHYHQGPLTLAIGYIGMNNQLVNQSVRKALAYAFDYNYDITQIGQNLDARLHGPIPAGMQFYNGSIPYVTDQNLTEARDVLIKMGAGLSWVTAAKLHIIPSASNDSWWTNLAATTPIATFNYTYNSGNQGRLEAGQLLQNCSKLIGISVNHIYADDWGTFITQLSNWTLQKYIPLFDLGWAPDFNDPDDYVHTLLVPGNPTSDMAHVNDAFVNKTVAMSLNATTILGRQDAYNALCNYTQNQLYPWIFTLQEKRGEVWLDNITGYTINIMVQPYFYPVECAQCTLPAAAVPGYDLTLIGIAMITASIISFLLVRKKIRV